MDHAEYVGPLRELKGKTALVQPHPGDKDKLLAQFDGHQDWRMGEKFDEHRLRHPETGVVLSHSWHEFPVADFKLRVRVRI